MKFQYISALVLIGALTGCGSSDGDTNGNPTDTGSSSSSSSAASSSSSSTSSSSSSSSGGEASALTIQEAETGFCYVDGDPFETKNANFTGIGYANADNATGEGIAWAVDSATSQSVQLVLRFANGGSTGRPGTLNVNEGSNGSLTVNFATTNSWSEWQEEAVTVDLVQGNNVLQLAADTMDGLANIDYLQVIGENLSAGDCSEVTSPGDSGSSGVVIGDGPMLPQSGNPVYSRYNKYKSEWSKNTNQADIIVSHQYNNGGWPKNQDYDSAGSGGNGNGTIDNGATTLEMTYLADMYKDTGASKYRDSVRNALQFLFDAQYDSGAWPQFYPLRNGYWDYATYNDNAMSRVLTLLHQILQRAEPYDTDVITDSQREQVKQALAKGIDYVLKSQWKQNGKLTVWGAQHDPVTYAPTPARAFEPASLASSESVEIIAFLMTQPQAPEIEAAVKAGIAWFRSEDTKVANTTYVRGSCSSPYDESYDAFQYSQGNEIWYRFYDLHSNEGIFGDRDGNVYSNFTDISAERRHCYSWGGNYGDKIINYANSVGY